MTGVMRRTVVGNGHYFRQPVQKSSSELYLTLKMTYAQVVQTSVVKNGPSQDSSHPDDHFQPRYITPGFKPFFYILGVLYLQTS